MFKLGEQVQFSRHYAKGWQGFRDSNMETWTEDQYENYENTGIVVAPRVLINEHESKAGLIVGIKRIPVSRTFKFALINPTGDYKYSDRCDKWHDAFELVYLVACNLHRFYKVHPDWLVRVEVR